MHGKSRSSKQRDRILELLQSDRIHASAQWMYKQLHPEFPHLSLGNVYRNLNILVEHGRVNRVSLGNSSDVYEAVRSPHVHFVCDRCGTVFDIDIPDSIRKQVYEYVAEHEGHLITSRSFELHGVCRECRVTPDESS